MRLLRDPSFWLVFAMVVFMVSVIKWAAYCKDIRDSIVYVITATPANTLSRTFRGDHLSRDANSISFTDLATGQPVRIYGPVVVEGVAATKEKTP